MRTILDRIDRPSRHIGGEPGSCVKTGRPVAARIALAFPDLYEVGMSYTGQKILYHAVNAEPNLAAERVFSPTLETARIMRDEGVPLSTQETETPLAELDVVAFHLTHELCYTNVLFMLDLAGIPLRAAERRDDQPLVIAGGGCAFNAEPMAPFFDVLVIGDGETVIVEIMDAVAEAKRCAAGKDELLLRLSRLPGVYIPSFFETNPDNSAGAPGPLHADYSSVEKRIEPELSAAAFPTQHITPFADTVHDRLAVEIARGCTRGCRFCQAGMIYRPVRERTPDEIAGIVEQGLAQTGFEEVSFLSLSTGDYSDLEGLFDRTMPGCKQEQVAISLPSMRVGSVGKDVMAHLAGLRRTGVTIAPEAGSQRLRDVINKGVDEASLLRHVRMLFGQGWQQVKLYFMIGLPTETDEDLEAIVDLCLKVRDAAGRSVKRLQVTASVSPFVPKPHTPFQWEPQISMAEVIRRIDFLREGFKRHKRIKLKWHVPEMSWLEGVFSRGDRRLAPAVLEAYRRGALFASWKDKLRLEPWREAFEAAGVDPEAYLQARNPQASLPWDHLNCGVSKDFLLRERERALAVRRTLDCRYGNCVGCGVCTIDGHASELSVQARSMDIRPRVYDPEKGRTEPEIDDVLPSPSTEQAPTRDGRPPRPEMGKLADKAAHVRLWHRKLGGAAYLSQIELARTMERAFRRANIPLTFSSGYHPLPRISYGHALPVGVFSLCERLSILLREPMTAEEALSALAEQLPSTLKPFAAEDLPMERDRYRLSAEVFVLRYPELTADVRDAWEAALSKEDILWERMTKKGPRSLNAREFLVSAEPVSGRLIRLRLDWSRQYVNPLGLVKALTPTLEGSRPRLVKIKQIPA